MVRHISHLSTLRETYSSNDGLMRGAGPVSCQLTHGLLAHDAAGLLDAGGPSRGGAALAHGGLTRWVTTPALGEGAVHRHLVALIDAT